MRIVPRNAAFTLVELLVVIAIIATLIGLLLPAVQSAREAARSVQCRNNLKQVGVALLSHHNSTRSFPIGGIGSPSSSFYGHSWWIGLLPYLEEQSVYDRFDRTGTSTGTYYTTTGWLNDNAHNKALLDGFKLAAAKCPSSPIPALFTHTTLPQNFTMFTADYTGISGSSDHPTATSNTLTGGRVSLGGLLIPKKAVRLAEATDGASKTFLVAEQSDQCRLPDGRRVECRSACGIEFSMGISSIFPDDPRTFNLTTVRYPICKDATLQSVGGALNKPDVIVQSGWCGNNSPIQSAHPGTANAVRADGSVEALGEDCDLMILKHLADRNDGF
jgi:prepilin-type N-terminal cleavage/methylation domain-containing protein/prepilin-type processing-associated H-X9-DG protein